jgi:L-ascorbate metabolism protein UlaG (beta-lactamase superfamily)
MQIKFKGKDKFEIKSKELEIILDGKVSINGYEFPGPGEYEKAGVILNGIADGDNTIYVLNAEEMNICYLGKLNHVLSEEEGKEIGDVDILFLPLGEDGSADLKVATKIISTIDPRVVIPMLYADLVEFKKSEGVTDGELEVLKIRKIDMPEDERKIITLSAS